MENSPFNRSARTARTPPSTPAPGPAAPSQNDDDMPEVISTPELSNWMSSIEQCLNEVCSIASEGKLNAEQKLRINNLCRKVAHGTSQMAVHYQSVKLRTVQAHSSIQTLKSQLDLSQQLQDLKMSIDQSSKPATDLSQRLQDLKHTIEESSKPALGTSFADMVKKGTNNFIQPTNFSSVVIYPNNKEKSSEETKSLVQKLICPEQMKLHVRGLRKTKNGGVIISTDTKEDIMKLKQSVQLTNSGLTIDEPHKRKPRVVVIGVPSSMQEKDVFTCLYHQNLADKLQNVSLESFLSSIKLSHKSGKKDADTCNYVIEVTASIRKALITKDRVFVNWSSCPVRDFTLVTRCYKCQQYGHAAKSCRDSAYTCGHCGNQGHAIKECPKKSEDPKCATCMHYKKPCGNTTGAADCPAKISAEKRYINSIDYEGA
ncbi:uncharacterized protein [Choristoneura fumiferana]|uniref:uncharacterized protein n=1 Tax=Choristoneura fumiferana TaxID=7141 RepID=UPI003D15CDD4